MKLTEGAAILLILLLAAVVVGATSKLFHAFSFPWLAWCALGYSALVTFGRELITVRDPSDGPPAGPIESLVNATLAKLLLSMPLMFVAASIALALLVASVETHGLIATLASIVAMCLVVKNALRI